VVLAATIVVITYGSATEAVELSGVVQQVMGDRIAIRIAPDLLPNPGDTVEVLNTVPDLGDIALDCEWRVESVQGDVVLAATQDKSRATAQPDYKAVIHSSNPRRIGPPATEEQPAIQKPPVDSKSPDKMPPVGDGAKGQKTPISSADAGSPAIPSSQDGQAVGDVPDGMVLMDKGLFGDGTSVPEATPSFDEWLKSTEGSKANEASLEKGPLGEDESSQVVVGVFEEPPPAAGGVTLDDVVRVNQGVFDPNGSSRQLARPVGLEAEEPWVAQWRVFDALVEFPGGGRSGLYRDAVRSGHANPSPGRQGILYLHPLTVATPVRITHSTVLEGSSPVLKLGVCGNRDVDGDWLLVVNVDGARLAAERLVRGADGWQDLTYDLSGFSVGRPVQISVEAHANDWRCEYAFFDYLRIEDDVPPAVPMEDATPPVVARVERVIVEDRFDSENGGVGLAGYDGFENWYVRGGEVDLLGRGFQDAYPDHGLYVDMDGSGFSAGTLQSKGAYRLSPGLYRLQFDLAGNPERTENTMTVSLGKLYSESFTLEAQEPFRTISREIGVEKAVNASLVFKHAGRDKAGLLLDNISLAAISYPGTESLGPRRTAYLGVRVTKRIGSGFDLVDVTAQGPAQLAGLRKGDLITLIDGGTLADADLGASEFAEMVSGLPCDRPVRFTVQRNGKALDIWVRPKPKE